MKKEDKASLTIMKIMCVSIILVLVSGIGVMAVKTDIKDIKIELQNGYEMEVLTSKSTVKEILEENNILLEENQKTIPGVDEEIEAGKNIRIVDKSYNEVQIAKISEEGSKATIEKLLKNYAPITEKIVKEKIDIPYETITKKVTKSKKNTTNMILQQGKKGKKIVTYKVKYQNKEEIEKTKLSEKIIKKPVNKIVQVTTKTDITSRSGLTRGTLPSTTAKGNGTIYKITAYCPCAQCCGKTNGITAMGTKATAGRTIAASSQFSFGTKLNINGHTYTVEDRGGAIQGNKIDIFVNTHAQALQWGVRYLPVSVAK